jgi:enoyl-CoA hydratase/carnithine racemase
MDNIKYIVIKGSGGNFSTGNDLNVFGSKEMQALTPKLRG